MLQCAANFSNGYGGKDCAKCKVEDNENHRMNYCPEWSHINRANKSDKIDFNLIHSEDVTEAMSVVREIATMWDLGNGKNSMRSDDQ